MATRKVYTLQPGDLVRPFDTTAWEDPDHGNMGYADGPGLLKRNPTQETKYAICFLSYEQDVELDQSECTWIPIPNNTDVITVKLNAATPDDPGARGLLSKVRGFIGRKAPVSMLKGADIIYYLTQEGQDAWDEYAGREAGLRVGQSASDRMRDPIKGQLKDDLLLMSQPRSRAEIIDRVGEDRFHEYVAKGYWTTDRDKAINAPEEEEVDIPDVPEGEAPVFETDIYGLRIDKPVIPEELTSPESLSVGFKGYSPRDPEDPSTFGEGVDERIFSAKEKISRIGPKQVGSGLLKGARGAGELGSAIVEGVAVGSGGIVRTGAKVIKGSKGPAGSTIGTTAEIGKETSKYGGRQIKRLGQYGSSLLLSTLRSSETGKMMRLSRVPVGQNVMFVADEGVHGIERGDRGQVRMGARGKDKVVYIPDTGEIVYPSQWTVVSLVGMIQTPESGVLNVGLGRFHERSARYQGSGYQGSSMPVRSSEPGAQYDVRVELPSGHSMSARAFSELSNDMKIKLGGGIRVVGGNKGAKQRNIFLAQHFPMLLTDEAKYSLQYEHPGVDFSSQDRTILQHELERTHASIYGTRSEAGLPTPVAKGSRGTISVEVKRNEEKYPETDGYYVEVLMPYQRLMTMGEASRTKAKGTIVEESKIEGLVHQSESEKIVEAQEKIAEMVGVSRREVPKLWKSKGEAFNEQPSMLQLQELLDSRKERVEVVPPRISREEVVASSQPEGTSVSDPWAEASGSRPEKMTFFGSNPFAGAGEINIEDFYGEVPEQSEQPLQAEPSRIY